MSQPAPADEARLSARRTPPQPRSTATRDLLPPAAGYALLLVAAITTHLGALATHLPREPNAYDAQLITWILSWVARAMVDPAATFFGANINHPAPAQLTGSDYFLTSQLLFAPLVWLTGNAVLAVNLTALASYWLAGLCAERLLRAVGCSAGVAFFGGGALMLGPLQLPYNVHVLQHPAFLLPAIALALVRLRERPGAIRATLVAAVFAVGLLASMYAALICGVTTLVWATCELLRPLPRRLAFIALGATAATIATLPLLLVLPPYLARAATQVMADPQSRDTLLGPSLLDPMMWWFAVRHLPVDTLLTVVGALGLAGAAWRVPAARRLVLPAVACIAIGKLLIGGVPTALKETFAADALRGVRYPHRFQQVSGFGWTLLVAAGLETIVERWPKRMGQVAIAALLLALVAKEPRLGSGTMQEIVSLGRDRAVHHTVGVIVRENGGGAMVVLPLHGSPAGDGTDPGKEELLEPDAMLASTQHWTPLVNGYTGHQPGHRLLVSTLLRRIHQPAALDDLVDATHLRWILLRPASAWPAKLPREPIERALRAAPAVGRAWDLSGWLLLEIVRRPEHPSWYETIASGRAEQARSTVLGTPLVPLPSGADVGTITAVAPLPIRVATRQWLAPDFLLHNLGSAPWPAVPAPDPALILDLTFGANVPRTSTVVVTHRWIPLDAGPGAASARDIPLRRDVPAGETIRETLVLVAPAQPGRYRLELKLQQVDGARFDGPGNVPFAHELLVVPALRPPAARRVAPPPAGATVE